MNIVWIFLIACALGGFILLLGAGVGVVAEDLFGWSAGLVYFLWILIFFVVTMTMALNAGT